MILKSASGEVPPEDHYFWMGVYLCQIVSCLLSADSIPHALLKGEEGLFLPFVVDSDADILMEMAFQYENMLTRYECTGCQRHIVWVERCGTFLYDNTIDDLAKRGIKPLCPVCGTLIGHTGYN